MVELITQFEQYLSLEDNEMDMSIIRFILLIQSYDDDKFFLNNIND